ncbi:MAG: hypothetical protein IJD13_02845 [Oscillospiraceae bacterium]|nr:hypothetical protein [Oscillospiraceae bacterium]
MSSSRLKYDYGSGEVSTTFEEFAAYLDRPVYEVKALYEKTENSYLTAMYFRGEDLGREALRRFADRFSQSVLCEAGYPIRECMSAYEKCCQNVKHSLARRFYLPDGAKIVTMPRHILWMFALTFSRQDGPFYTEAEWDRLLHFGDTAKDAVAFDAVSLAEADELVRERKLSPAQASELLIRVMKSSRGSF